MTDVRVFHHHVSTATLLELILDALLCFLAVPLLLSGFGQGTLAGLGTQGTLVTAASYALAIPLLFSVVGIYRRNAVPVSRGAMLTRGLLALFGAVVITALMLHPLQHVDTATLAAQMALVGLGRVMARPVVRDGRVVAARTLHATLAADHRVSDGLVGARFLTALQQHLAQPESLA